MHAALAAPEPTQSREGRETKSGRMEVPNLGGRGKLKKGRVSIDTVPSAELLVGVSAMPYGSKARHFRRAPGVFAVMAALFLAGCSSQTYPVEGIVVFPDGNPATELAGGSVSFNSEETKTSASGPIGEDGRFHLSTSQEHDGAMPGKYHVTVSPPAPEGRDDKAAAARRPPSYKLRTSEVTIERKRNELTLTVEKAKGP
jgi:hypothetical protein